MDVVDTHNDLLWVMTATGLAGTIPFVTGFGSVPGGHGAGKGRSGLSSLGIVYGSADDEHELHIQNRKITWMLSAYAASSATYIVPTPKKRLSPPRKRYPWSK